MIIELFNLANENQRSGEMRAENEKLESRRLFCHGCGNLFGLEGFLV